MRPHSLSRARRAGARITALFLATLLWGCAGPRAVTQDGRTGGMNAWGPVYAEPADAPRDADPPVAARTPAASGTGCAAPLAETEPRYLLPYEVGAAFEVRQGTCGPVTHRGRFAFAYDFDMPRGTPVLAARDGVVTAVVEHFPEDTNRSDEANYVVVRHDGGEASRYLHLQQDGVVVAVGDTVRAGDRIAYSGNSGRSVSPHLHFDVIGDCTGACPTLPATFLNAEDEALRAGRTYEARPLQ